MIGAASTSEKNRAFFSKLFGFVILDPVLASFSGYKQDIEQLVKLFPYVDVVIPNLNEAEKY